MSSSLTLTSCRGSPLLTSYVVSRSSWTRTSVLPSVLTTSGSSTPASWTLVPVALEVAPVNVPAARGATFCAPKSAVPEAPAVVATSSAEVNSSRP